LLGLPPLPHRPGCQCPLCRNGYQLLPPPVPEPFTLVIWAVGILAVASGRGTRARVRSRRRVGRSAETTEIQDN
jgi:hypothetical protein